MTEAYVGLGSNQSTDRGDASVQLDAALASLRTTPELTVDAISPLYWTEPQGLNNQPWFANRVVRLLCGASWSARDLLKHLLQLEAELGRVRPKDAALRFGPRIIDMDVLLFGQERSQDCFCTLPHPRMLQRAFVLVPLQDIAPGIILADGITVEQALARLCFRVQEQRIYQAE